MTNRDEFIDLFATWDEFRKYMDENFSEEKIKTDDDLVASYLGMEKFRKITNKVMNTSYYQNEAKPKDFEKMKMVYSFCIAELDKDEISELMKEKFSEYLAYRSKHKEIKSDRPNDANGYYLKMLIELGCVCTLKGYLESKQNE